MEKIPIYSTALFSYSAKDEKLAFVHNAFMAYLLDTPCWQPARYTPAEAPSFPRWSDAPVGDSAAPSQRAFLPKIQRLMEIIIITWAHDGELNL